VLTFESLYNDIDERFIHNLFHVDLFHGSVSDVRNCILKFRKHIYTQRDRLPLFSGTVSIVHSTAKLRLGAHGMFSLLNVISQVSL
jgi:hypothetical protein